MRKNVESLAESIMKRVSRMPADACFSRSDFASLGTRLAVSVILTKDSVCPRFRPEEFGLPCPAEPDGN